ncbi:isochorismatase family protein [Streptomyces sp. NPDC089799]|uniref:isochorismatase family protein n=1 Tax=Streptomyces sp. NPDC089799 TaxID=3155066 RepID=UPI0034142EB5
MALPPIEPYALPTATATVTGPAPTATATGLPDSPLRHWRPEPERAALLVHDMQRYFLRPYADREPLPQVTANIAALAAHARAGGIPVVYTRQPPRQPTARRGLLADLWGPGPGALPDDADIPDPLRPRPGDTVLTKHRYSAFHGTPLLDLLRRAGRDQLLVTGVYAHLGCLLTCADAFMNDIRPFLLADATADFDPGLHRMALDYAAARCAKPTTTALALADLAPAPPGK